MNELASVEGKTRVAAAITAIEKKTSGVLSRIEQDEVYEAAA